MKLNLALYLCLSLTLSLSLHFSSLSLYLSLSLSLSLSISLSLSLSLSLHLSLSLSLFLHLSLSLSLSLPLYLFPQGERNGSVRDRRELQTYMREGTASLIVLSYIILYIITIPKGKKGNRAKCVRWSLHREDFLVVSPSFSHHTYLYFSTLIKCYSFFLSCFPHCFSYLFYSFLLLSAFLSPCLFFYFSVIFFM